MIEIDRAALSRRWQDTCRSAFWNPIVLLQITVESLVPHSSPVHAIDRESKRRRNANSILRLEEKAVAELILRMFAVGQPI